MEDVNLAALFKKTFAGRSVLVTGHTGFKGAWLCLWLLESGARVHGYALAPETEPSLAKAAKIADLMHGHTEGDLRDEEKLRRAFEAAQPEFVFHLAAQALVRRSYKQPVVTFEANALGTARVLERVRLAPSVRVLINVTSDKCYENRDWPWGYRENDRLGGHDPYSASKAAAEIVFAAYWRSFFEQRSGFGAGTVRAGNCIGGGDWSADRIVPDAVRALVVGKPIPVRNPDAARPWQHVLEPLSGYLLLAARLSEEPKKFSGAWNFGPHAHNSVSVRELVISLISAWGSGSWDDLSVRQAGAPHEARALTLACEKARQELGWRPRWDLDATVQATAKWYKSWHDGRDVRELCRAQSSEYQEGA